MAWITKNRRLAIYNRDNFICGYCGQKKGSESNLSRLTLDHIVPRTRWHGKGSVNKSRNLVTCCQECNSRKKDRTLQEYIDYLIYSGWRIQPRAIKKRVEKFRRRSVKNL